MDDQQGRKSVRGRPKKSVAERQSSIVAVRLTPAELCKLDAARPSGISRGEYLRSAGFGRNLPRPVPEINIRAWRKLGKTAGGLATIAKAMGIYISLAVRAAEGADFGWVVGDRRAVVELYLEIVKLRHQLLMGDTNEAEPG